MKECWPPLGMIFSFFSVFPLSENAGRDLPSAQKPTKEIFPMITLILRSLFPLRGTILFSFLKCAPSSGRRKFHGDERFPPWGK